MRYIAHDYQKYATQLLPVPGKIKAVLEQLHDRAEKTETEEK